MVEKRKMFKNVEGFFLFCRHYSLYLALYQYMRNTFIFKAVKGTLRLNVTMLGKQKAKTQDKFCHLFLSVAFTALCVASKYRAYCLKSRVLAFSANSLHQPTSCLPKCAAEAACIPKSSCLKGLTAQEAL